MLGFHHGHKKKMAQLPKLFSSEPRFRKLWGQATQAYIHTGHMHHERTVRMQERMSNSTQHCQQEMHMPPEAAGYRQEVLK